MKSLMRFMSFALNKKHFHLEVGGFSLVELTIVLAIFMTISYIAISTFGSMEKRLLQRASEELSSNIKFVQNMELNSETDYMILFESKRYSIFKDSIVSLPIKNVKPFGIKNITKNNGNVLEFTEKGTTQSGTTLITLFTKGYCQEITTSLGSGYVHIKEIKKY